MSDINTLHTTNTILQSTNLIQTNKTKPQIQVDSLMEDTQMLQLKRYKLQLKYKLLTKNLPLKTIPSQLKLSNTAWDVLLLNTKLKSVDLFEHRKWKKAFAFILAKQASMKIEKIKSNEKMTELYNRCICLHRSILINNSFSEMIGQRSSDSPLNSYLKRTFDHEELKERFSKWKLSLRLIKQKLFKVFGEDVESKAKEIVKLIKIMDNMIKIHEVKTRKALNMNSNTNIKQSSLNMSIDETYNIGSSTSTIDISKQVMKKSSDLSLPGLILDDNEKSAPFNFKLLFKDIEDENENEKIKLSQSNLNNTSQTNGNLSILKSKDNKLNKSTSMKYLLTENMNKVQNSEISIMGLTNELDKLISDFNKEANLKIKDVITFRQERNEKEKEKDVLVNSSSIQTGPLGKIHLNNTQNVNEVIRLQQRKESLVGIEKTLNEFEYGFSPNELFYEFDIMSQSENDTGNQMINTVNPYDQSNIDQNEKINKSNMTCTYKSGPSNNKSKTTQTNDFIDTLHKNIKGEIVIFNQDKIKERMTSNKESLSLYNNSTSSYEENHETSFEKCFKNLFPTREKPEKSSSLTYQILPVESEMFIKKYERKFELDPNSINHFNLKFEKITKIQELLLFVSIGRFGLNPYVLSEVLNIVPLTKSMSFDGEEIMFYIDKCFESKYEIDMAASNVDNMIYNLNMKSQNESLYNKKNIFDYNSGLLNIAYGDYSYNENIDYIKNQKEIEIENSNDCYNGSILLRNSQINSIYNQYISKSIHENRMESNTFLIENSFLDEEKLPFVQIIYPLSSNTSSSKNILINDNHQEISKSILYNNNHTATSQVSNLTSPVLKLTELEGTKEKDVVVKEKTKEEDEKPKKRGRPPKKKETIEKSTLTTNVNTSSQVANSISNEVDDKQNEYLNKKREKEEESKEKEIENDNQLVKKGVNNDENKEKIVYQHFNPYYYINKIKNRENMIRNKEQSIGFCNNIEIDISVSPIVNEAISLFINDLNKRLYYIKKDYSEYNSHNQNTLYSHIKEYNLINDFTYNSLQLIRLNYFILKKSFLYKKQVFKDLKKALLNIVSYNKPLNNNNDMINSKNNTNSSISSSMFTKNQSISYKKRLSSLDLLKNKEELTGLSMRKEINTYSKGLFNNNSNEELLDGVAFYSQNSISKEWGLMRLTWYQNNYYLKNIFRKVNPQVKNENNYSINNMYGYGSNTVNSNVLSKNLGYSGGVIKNLSDNISKL